MRTVPTIRGAVSLLTALLVLASFAGVAGAEDLAPQTREAAPVQVAVAAEAMPASQTDKSGLAGGESREAAVAPPASPCTELATPAPGAPALAALPPAPMPAADVPATAVTAPAAAAALSDAGAENAKDAEALPEDAETPPELVGPNDDQLLKEVEKKVNAAPAEPALAIADPLFDMPLELNSKVLDYIEIFQTSRRRNFEHGLVRSRKYEAMMKPIFQEYGVPTDLYYLALIESGYNPRAYSYARAMGIWQFISSTGKIYGLRRNEWMDERCDAEKATRAAAHHLKDLYDEFGSWPLVLAAYNAGKGRVQRDIARAGTTDFWSLPLPAQTRNYVPAFFAALIIAKDPERYGFQPEYEEPPAVEHVEVSGGTRLSLVAALTHTSVDELRALNPELRKACAPPGGKYALHIPAGQGEALHAGLAKVPPGKATAGWVTYRVVPGDTLFSIAQRFGTTAEALREANRLKDTALRPGNQLTIPGRTEIAGAAIPRAPGRVVVSSAIPRVYAVQKGDNPWSIARKFNVALEELLAWNGLETDSVLKIGQPITLREPAIGETRTARGPATTTYEVRKGDNLWEISRRFDASVEELRRINGFGTAHRLQIGDRVIVPAGKDSL
jgi:membrane-bound lytic murein transglycosylase D